jgi:hypothetical protein
LTSTFEDDRFSYDERRFVTLGLLDGVILQIYGVAIGTLMGNVISSRMYQVGDPMRSMLGLTRSRL